VRACARAAAVARAALALAAAVVLGLPAAEPQAVRWDEPVLQAAGQRLGASGVRAAAELRQLLSQWHLQSQSPSQAQAQPQAQAQAHARASTALVRPAAMVGLTDLAGDVARLHVVNDFFNQRIRFATDRQTWGVEDHWTTPLEVLARGQGDCEDYAIAKYAVLLAAGMPASRLRLVYVRARLPAAQPGAAPVLEPHMVLAYHAEPGDEPLILDNLRPDILPAGQRPDLMPVFSFNSEGLWDAATAQPAGHPLVRLSRWRELVQRLRAEGWQP
jgi:predicted transglutaminase-like cysteine proteinase